MADIRTLVIEFYVFLPGQSIVNATHTLIRLDHMTMGAISPMLLKLLLRPLGLQITGKHFQVFGIEFYVLFPRPSIVNRVIGHLPSSISSY